MSGHWDAVYRTKRSDEVSWYRVDHALSLQLLEGGGLTSASCVIDVGGGDSSLVDVLLARGLTCLTVLDVAGAALQRARTRTGDAGRVVRWLEADVTAADWVVDPVDAWHDRAVFHFLTDAADRARYVARLHRHVKPGGTVVMATFALDGPERCSGLPVERYSPQRLHETLGEGFRLDESRDEDHHTPTGAVQRFQWSRFTRLTPPPR